MNYLRKNEISKELSEEIKNVIDIIKSFKENRDILKELYPQIDWSDKHNHEDYVSYRGYKFLEKEYYKSLNGESYQKREKRLTKYKEETHILSKMFKHTKKIIINNDDDGILSGALLVKLYGCQIAGFIHKDELILIEERKCISVNSFSSLGDSNYMDLNDYVFIDCYINIDGVKCIDNHYIAFNKHMQCAIQECGYVKLNPNTCIEIVRKHERYDEKYPFATFHFLWTLAEREGKSFSGELLYKIIDKELNITIGDLFTRADDAMYSSRIAYLSNCEKWWNRLYHYSHNAPNIKKLKNYIYNYDGDIDEQKARVKEFMKQYDLKIDKNSSHLSEKFKNYLRLISRIFNIDLSYLMNVKLCHFQADCKIMKVSSKAEVNKFIEICKKCNVFSYAKTSGTEVSFSILDFYNKRKYKDIIINSRMLADGERRIYNNNVMSLSVSNSDALIENKYDVGCRIIVPFDGMSVEEDEEKLRDRIKAFYMMYAA